MTQHQPGPYGVPPQQPAPQPDPYGRPGYGYGGPPYQPQPQQPGGWGPGMPPPYPPPIPPQGGGKGKAIALAVGAVVLVGAIVGGIVLLTGSGRKADDKAGGETSPTAPASPSPSTPATPAGKSYKLIAPETVAGEYKKDPSEAGSGFGSKELDDLKILGITNPRSVSGAYKSGEDKLSQKQLRFTGAWGDEVRSPEVMVDGLFLSVTRATANEKNPDAKTEFEGTPQRMSPAGLGDDAVMKCQITKWSNSGVRTMKMPLCIWADKHTVGTVFALDMTLLASGQDLGLEEAANRTARLRQDVRVGTGG
ncbi:hypothetical protein ACFWAT_21430 [Streptomyces syringium]|uniref:hypothetical protein n=1 Tax=Streptomyces syringium TaxID=76729 RepID=UPI003648707E